MTSLAAVAGLGILLQVVGDLMLDEQFVELGRGTSQAPVLPAVAAHDGRALHGHFGEPIGSRAVRFLTVFVEIARVDQIKALGVSETMGA